MALPIHDAILVQASAARVATNVRTQTFWVKARLDAVVAAKTLDDLEDPLRTAA